MAGRARHIFYCFISNPNGEYYSCDYSTLGEPIISRSGSPIPLKTNPADLQSLQPEFATNKQYFSLNRSITNQLQFIKDGADILRNLDYTGRGFEEDAFLIIVKYNPVRGIYELYYTGKFDFSKKKDDPILGFTINTVDSGVWGILSQKDDIQVQIPCSALNPKAIKVLFDGVTLKAKYYWQPVADVDMDLTTSESKYLIVPLVMTNTDGDSYGIISAGQEYDYFHDPDMNDYVSLHQSVYFIKTQYSTEVYLEGPMEFDITSEDKTPFSISFYLWRSTDTVDDVWELPDYQKLYFKRWDNLNDKHDTISFKLNHTFDLSEGEYLVLVAYVHYLGGGFLDGKIKPHLTPKAHNIIASVTTKVVPTTCYALRPLDLGQQIVSKLTGGLFTIQSKFYVTHNKVVCTCGDALRGEPLAMIQTTFKDWYESYDAGDFLAMKILNGQLWIEQANEVYKENGEILDIGEISDLSIEHDTEHLLNSFEIGSPSQDYRHNSGRLEFNAPTQFSFEVSYIKNQMSLISPYRRDSYGIEFIRLDYFAGNSQDNKGDKEVFMLDITDEVGDATTFVSNYKIYQVNNSPIIPEITSPDQDETITYQQPRIRGNAPSGQIVNIYVDSVLDGSVTAIAGNTWSYNIKTKLDPLVISDNTIITTGIHKVEVTFTDLTGTTDSVTFTILSSPTEIGIVYPADRDNLIDNKPLFKGRGQTGQVLTIWVDYLSIGTVTVDNSCWWEIQSSILPNGIHTLTVYLAGVVMDTCVFNVDTNTEIPIIIRPVEQFTLINNLPLVEGVAKPGTSVNLYLDYYYKTIGTAIANGTGNWSIQLVPVNRDDGITVITPIPNGEHVLSTGLAIQQTAVKSTGYKLNRPNYDSITGVYDNTVFNVELSPKRMLLSRSSYWASLMYQNKSTVIQYNGNDKNQALSTTYQGNTIQENADVLISDLGQALFLPIKASFKTEVPDTFNEVFNYFNTGGHIKATFQGNDLWFLPIGRMTVNDVTNNVQTWNLLFAVKTPLATLLNLSRQGLTLNLMTNAIHHSDYNSLHFVKYNYTLDSRYHAKGIYDDWFDARNDRWTNNPLYIQKFQTNDSIRDQVITNGVSTLTLNMYRCIDAFLVATFVYNPVSPSPIPPPDVVREAIIDFSMYPAAQYFFVMMSGSTPVAISERVETRTDWYDTILIESTNSANLTGFMYSTGIVSKLRIEGLVQKWQPNISILANTDEVGDNQMLHSVFSRQRKILLGKASGLPDYLYLKASALVILDNLMIEGVNYVASKENKLQEQDRVLGHPMYRYELEVELADNNQGVVFDAGLGGADITSVVITVDAEAFGSGGSQLIDITVKGE